MLPHTEFYKALESRALTCSENSVWPCYGGAGAGGNFYIIFILATWCLLWGFRFFPLTPCLILPCLPSSQLPLQWGLVSTGEAAQTGKPSGASVPGVSRDPTANMVSYRQDHLKKLLDLWWDCVLVNSPKWEQHAQCYTVSMRCLPWWSRSWRELWLAAAARHCKRLAYHISLAREKIKSQNSKYGFYWMNIAFAPLSSWKVVSRAVLSWRLSVWGFGVVCGAFRGQPILSIQTNGWFVPLGIGEHLK